MSFEIQAFSDALPFARRLAAAVGVGCRKISVHRFPDGESLVRVAIPVARTVVVVRSLDDPNSRLLEVLLAGDALRHAGAERVELVAPYLAYMRQDAVFKPGEPISQRVVGALLANAFERVLTIEAHLHRIRSLREIAGAGALSVSAAPAVAEWVRRRGVDCIVGPDEESEPWVRAIAERAGVQAVVGVKQRRSDRDVRIEFERLPTGGRVVLVDDIASSGTTLARAAAAVRRRRPERIDAVVVHPLFATGALEMLRAAGIAELVSCDTIAHPTNRIRAAQLLTSALTRNGKRPRG